MKGFSLIETLIYSTIFVIASGLLLSTLTIVTKNEVQETANNEVITQIDFVMQTVRRLVGASSGLEISDGGKILTLYMPMDAKNPTTLTFPIPGDTLQIKEGATGVVTNLTTGKVTIDTATAIFTKFSNAGSFDAVKVNFTMSSMTGSTPVVRSIQTTIARANAATFETGVLPSIDNSIDIGSAGSKWKKGWFSGATFNDAIGIGLDALGYGTDQARIAVDGGIRLQSTNPKPTCIALLRGLLWFTQGGAGVKDALEVCAKDAGNAYAWRLIF